MGYLVAVRDVAARPTAVVGATTTWQEFPTLWPALLDEVWICQRAGAGDRGAHRAVLDWCAAGGIAGESGRGHRGAARWRSR